MAQQSLMETWLPRMVAAFEFAARKHRDQRRKDSHATPYINHPVAVAHILSSIGGVTDPVTIQAALLHDVLEDTRTTPEEIKELFGEEVLEVVQEITDDKTLPRHERKQRQIDDAMFLSPRGKQIKVADKICNLLDITATEPKDWTSERKREYVDWSARVVAGCRDTNVPLEEHFDAVLEKKRQAFASAGEAKTA